MPSLGFPAVCFLKDALHSDELIPNGICVDRNTQSETVHRADLSLNDLALKLPAIEGPGMQRRFCVTSTQEERHLPGHFHRELIPLIEDVHARNKGVGDGVAIGIRGRPKVKQEHVCLRVARLRADVRLAARLWPIGDTAGEHQCARQVHNYHTSKAIGNSFTHSDHSRSAARLPVPWRQQVRRRALRAPQADGSREAYRDHLGRCSCESCALHRYRAGASRR